jgi:hypothetical protein
VTKFGKFEILWPFFKNFLQTRLAEYSPIGRLFTMGSFFHYRSSQNLGVLFTQNGMYVGTSKWVGLCMYADFFHKLIWSPCFAPVKGRRGVEVLLSEFKFHSNFILLHLVLLIKRQPIYESQLRQKSLRTKFYPRYWD